MTAHPENKGTSTKVILIGMTIVCLVGILAFRGLGNATLYFRTADEAVAQRAELGEKRFRIEGTVVTGSLRPNGPNTDFAIESKGTTVQVQNKAETQGIFREGIPVVLEGRFQQRTNVFLSDRIMVKHDSSYTEKYPDRVQPAS